MGNSLFVKKAVKSKSACCVKTAEKFGGNFSDTIDATELRNLVEEVSREPDPTLAALINLNNQSSKASSSSNPNDRLFQNDQDQQQLISLQQQQKVSKSTTTSCKTVETIVRSIYKEVFCTNVNPNDAFLCEKAAVGYSVDAIGTYCDPLIPGYMRRKDQRQRQYTGTNLDFQDQFNVQQSGGVSTPDGRNLGNQSQSQNSSQNDPQFIDYSSLTEKKSKLLKDKLENRIPSDRLSQSDESASATLLECAALSGHMRLVQILASGGANLNPMSKHSIDDKGRQQQLPILVRLVTTHAPIQIIEYLLKKGSDVNARVTLSSKKSQSKSKDVFNEEASGTNNTNVSTNNNMLVPIDPADPFSSQLNLQSGSAKPPKYVLGDSMLLAALRAGNTQAAMLALKFNARLDVTDAHNNTVVHLAAAQAAGEVLQEIMSMSTIGNNTVGLRSMSMGSNNDHQSEQNNSINSTNYNFNSTQNQGFQLSQLKSENSDNLTPVMSARLGQIAPQLCIGPTGEWIAPSRPQKVVRCSCCGLLLSPSRVGNVWISDQKEILGMVQSSGKTQQSNQPSQQLQGPGADSQNQNLWVKCSLCQSFSPFFPTNHFLAAKLALRIGDIFSLADAVEGAWLGGLTPPSISAEHLNPEIARCVNMLVISIQSQLKLAIQRQDLSKLERGVELLNYAKIAGLQEDTMARDLIVRMKLQQALRESDNDLNSDTYQYGNSNDINQLYTRTDDETGNYTASKANIVLGQTRLLTQALMAADQYQRKNVPEYQEAKQKLAELKKSLRLEQSLNQLSLAIEQQDFRLLSLALRVTKETRQLQDDASNAASPVTISVTENENSTNSVNNTSKSRPDNSQAGPRNLEAEHLEFQKGLRILTQVIQENLDSTVRKGILLVKKYRNKNLEKNQSKSKVKLKDSNGNRAPDAELDHILDILQDQLEEETKSKSSKKKKKGQQATELDSGIDSNSSDESDLNPDFEDYDSDFDGIDDISDTLSNVTNDNSKSNNNFKHNHRSKSKNRFSNNNQKKLPFVRHLLKIKSLLDPIHRQLEDIRFHDLLKQDTDCKLTVLEAVFLESDRAMREEKEKLFEASFMGPDGIDLDEMLDDADSPKNSVVSRKNKKNSKAQELITSTESYQSQQSKLEQQRFLRSIDTAWTFLRSIIGWHLREAVSLCNRDALELAISEAEQYLLPTLNQAQKQNIIDHIIGKSNKTPSDNSNALDINQIEISQSSPEPSTKSLKLTKKLAKITTTSESAQRAFSEYQHARAEMVILPQKMAILLLSDASDACNIELQRQGRSDSKDHHHLAASQSGQDLYSQKLQRSGSDNNMINLDAQETADREKRILQQLEYSVKNAVLNEELRGLKLAESPEFGYAVGRYRKLARIPKNFDEKALLEKILSGRRKIQPYRKPRDDLQDSLQQLFDATNVRRRTRDRRGNVPTRLEIVRIAHIQNHSSYLDYIRGRQRVKARFWNEQNQNQSTGASVSTIKNWAMEARKLTKDGKLIDTKAGLNAAKDPANSTNSMIKTLAPLKDNRPFHIHIQKLDNLSSPPIDVNINEFYLFHGTTPKAAIKISEEDFRLNLAGSNAGALYGRGLYFAECCIKSDEYAQETNNADTDPKSKTRINDSSFDQESLNPMLICRVLCGKMLYSSDIYPDVEKIVRLCTSGEYDSVMGDRLKARGTYREIVSYDLDFVYPEFIAWYRRKF